MNIVLYHANCADGFGAAFAAWLKFGDAGAIYFPVKYGEPVPQEVWDLLDDEEDEKEVGIYLLDYSYEAAKLELLADHPATKEVVVLDHHQTALPLLGLMREGLDIFIDVKQSGAMLAWEYFHGGRACGSTPLPQAPELFRYIQDRDLWQWKLPNSREINAAIWGVERSFHYWRTMMENWEVDWAILMEIGRALCRGQEAMLTRLAEEPEAIHGPNGELGLRVNSPVLQSELGERLLEDNPLAEFAAIWYEGDGHRRVSLRSRPGGLDVSRIAALYGGGGHQGAAAYRGKCGVWNGECGMD